MLNELRTEIEKEAQWKNISNWYRQMQMGKNMPQLAVYQQIQKVKALETAKQLSKYKGLSKVLGGGIGAIALLSMLNKGGLGGLLGGNQQQQQMQPPTMINYRMA